MYVYDKLIMAKTVMGLKTKTVEDVRFVTDTFGDEYIEYDIEPVFDYYGETAGGIIHWYSCNGGEWDNGYGPFMHIGEARKLLEENDALVAYERLENRLLGVG